MDPISDMLIRIKNAQAVKKEQILVPFSRVKFDIANILKSAGFVFSVEKRKKKAEKSEHDILSIVLKYQDDHGALNGIKIISKPSRRIYIKAKDIKLVRSGKGLAVISTPKGIMTSGEAKKQNLGGELICEIY